MFAKGEKIMNSHYVYPISVSIILNCSGQLINLTAVQKPLCSAKGMVLLMLMQSTIEIWNKVLREKAISLTTHNSCFWQLRCSDFCKIQWSELVVRLIPGLVQKFILMFSITVSQKLSIKWQVTGNGKSIWLWRWVLKCFETLEQLAQLVETF